MERSFADRELNRLPLDNVSMANTVIQDHGVSRRSAGAVLDAAALLELEARPFLDIDAGVDVENESQAVVLAHEKLQDTADYRQALQTWFDAVAPGGRLILTVPHAFLHDRALRLEQRRRAGQKRLYTPASLLQEVEEALAPNTYRVQRLSDSDVGYDYDALREQAPKGAHHLILILQKIAPPQWTVSAAPSVATQPAAPDFEVARTRVEFSALAPRRRILALKLDHLGDFIMGLPALEALRDAFPSADITLVVGSWNLDLALESGLADTVVAFDVFPRNSNEEKVDVAGRTALFEALITEEYDIAVDLRIDSDTRGLLQSVRASLRAGVGARSRFPFLDVFLPVDAAREGPEQARRDTLDHHGFHSKDGLVRSQRRLHCDGSVARDNALVWGPYWSLSAGRYVFEPFLDIEGEGSLVLDVGLDTHRECGLVVPSTEPARLAFRVDRDNTQFEFRIWPMEGAEVPAFSFYGGLLIREGAASVLHQSEYARLLVELLRLRVSESGLLEEGAVF